MRVPVSGPQMIIACLLYLPTTKRLDRTAQKAAQSMLLLPLEQFPLVAKLALNSSPLSVAPSAAHTGDPTLNGIS